MQNHFQTIMRFFPCFLFLFLMKITSCSPHQQGTDQYDEQRFVRYYADVLILQEEKNLRAKDSVPFALRIDSLNKVYTLRQDQIDKTLQDYRKDLAGWKNFYQKVQQRLDTLQRQSAKPTM